MNERIKELALQAEWRFADKATGNFSEYDKRLLKFARLIVQECCEVAIQDWHTPDGWGFTSGQQKAVSLIKEHFGVAE